MNFDQEIANNILQKINNAQKIAIVPHRSPDGDAIGSALALKNAFINTEIICIDPAPEYTHFLQGSKDIKNELIPNNYDLIIFVDCGGKNMPKFNESILDLYSNQNYTTINIDHHSTNENYCQINLVQSNCASTTQILYNLFKFWKINITPEIATNLLTGIYFDTGSLKHNNTTIEVLKSAGELIKLGADLKSITKNLYKTNRINQLKLWGKILETAKINKNKIVSSSVTYNDIKKYKIAPKELEGIVDYLNCVPNSKFCVLLTEDDNNGIKASLRTQQTNINLSKLAQNFGGGGHPMASGFRIPGKINTSTYWHLN